ncbi:Uncharacterized protein APZ42_002007, partial [Daphnia magna]
LRHPRERGGPGLDRHALDAGPAGRPHTQRPDRGPHTHGPLGSTRRRGGSGAVSGQPGGALCHGRGLARGWRLPDPISPAKRPNFGGKGHEVRIAVDASPESTAVGIVVKLPDVDQLVQGPHIAREVTHQFGLGAWTAQASPRFCKATSSDIFPTMAL